MDVPVDKIKEFETDYIAFLHSKHQNILDDLASGKLTDRNYINIINSSC